ncbi:hypothetical protein DBR06_SOUSAS9010061, partial [Sousa chinensis]
QPKKVAGKDESSPKKSAKKGKEAQVANHDNKEYLAAENGETK